MWNDRSSTHWSEPHQPSEQELVNLDIVARQAADLIERKQAEDRTRTDLQAMTRLHDLGVQFVRPGAHLPLILQQVVEAAISFTGADKGNLQLFDRETQALSIAAQRGFEDPFLAFFSSVDGDGAATCGKALHSGQRVLIDDVTASPVFAGQPALQVLLDAGVRAVQSTPLLSSNSVVLGMISIHFSQPHRVGDRDQRLMDLLARQTADFLERKEAEEALKEANRRKDEFLATLAHELRNPLAPIRNGLQLMKLARDYIGRIDITRAMIERQLQQMVRLIDDLMDISRITRGKVELRKERTDLGKIVQQSVETSFPLIEAGKHELCIEVPSESILVEADATRLAQVVSNLLNNAAKYTPAGGRISVRLERRGEEAVVSVHDTGIGN
jgi:signal transduction histidine kinase